MTHRSDHVFTDAELGDGIGASENVPIVASVFRAKHGVEGFLQPSIPQRKGFVARKLWAIVVPVKRPSQHSTSDWWLRPVGR